MAPALLDGDETRVRRLVQRIARRRDAHPGPRRDLPQGQHTSAPVPHGVGDDPQRRQLAGRELAGELRRHGAGRRQRPPPLDRRPPVRRPHRLPLGWKMAQAALLSGGLGNLRRADRYGVDPSHLSLAALQRLRQRARLLVGEPPCSPVGPNGSGEPVEGGKRFRPADRGQ